jgi:glycosyltransferase involved in cell wall biosynthesis
VIRYESIISEFDLNLVCSDEDKEFLKKNHNVNRIDILPNGVDLDVFKNIEHDYSISDRIIFTGNMDYAPNVDAVSYFTKQILPLVTAKIPNVKFYIVGQKPARKVLNMQSERVVVTGFSRDLASEYDKSAVAVSPVRIGAGTLNKVLEPMAMGIPVVTTGVGFKGLGVESGEGVILAEERDEFAKQVIKLLENENYRKEVGIKGKKVVFDNFSWEKISLLLEGYLLNLVRN